MVVKSSDEVAIKICRSVYRLYRSSSSTHWNTRERYH